MPKEQHLRQKEKTSEEPYSDSLLGNSQSATASLFNVDVQADGSGNKGSDYPRRLAQYPTLLLLYLSCCEPVNLPKSDTGVASTFS